VQPKFRLAKIPSRRILVVDDNVTNRKLLERLLLEQELIPVLAEGGEEALEILKRSFAEEPFFSAMLLDQERPGFEGLAMVKVLRKRAHPHLPQIILMLSRPLKAEERFECERMGIAGMISKPVRRATLLEALGNALGRADQGRRQAKKSTQSLEARASVYWWQRTIL
jgi:CheY-like chemotaxis protein